VTAPDLPAVARFAANPSARFNALQDRFETLRNRFLLARQVAGEARAAELESWLDAMEADVDSRLAAVEGLIGAPRAAARPDADIHRSLAIAIENLGKTTAAGLWAIDTLHSQIVERAPEPDRAYWEAVPPERVSGLLQRTKPMLELLASRGILTWFGWQDRRHRVIDVNWLTAHADIRAFVAGEMQRGKRCRFCRMIETPAFNGFVAVLPRERNALVPTAAVVVLQTDAVHVHAECGPYWRQWVQIAESYASQDAAEEADRVAGRVPRSAPEPRSFEPDPPQALPPGYSSEPTVVDRGGPSSSTYD
jgi:hypothetical protein